MNLKELAGKVCLSASLLCKGLSADMLYLVVGQFNDSSNALVGAVLPAVGGWSHCPEPQQ